MVPPPHTSDEGGPVNHGAQKVVHLVCSQPVSPTARASAKVGNVRYSHSCTHSVSEDPDDLTPTVKREPERLLF